MLSAAKHLDAQRGNPCPRAQGQLREGARCPARVTLRFAQGDKNGRDTPAPTGFGIV
jgi:hypothetical protein